MSIITGNICVLMVPTLTPPQDAPPMFFPNPSVSRPASHLTEEEQVKIAKRMGLITHLPCGIFDGTKKSGEWVSPCAEVLKVTEHVIQRKVFVYICLLIFTGFSLVYSRDMNVKNVNIYHFPFKTTVFFGLEDALFFLENTMKNTCAFSKTNVVLWHQRPGLSELRWWPYWLNQ